MKSRHATVRRTLNGGSAPAAQREALRSAGYEVRRGVCTFFRVEDCPTLSMPHCYGNNPTSPYGLVRVASREVRRMRSLCSTLSSKNAMKKIIPTMRTTVPAGILALGLLLTTVLVSQGQQPAATTSRSAAGEPTLVQVDGGTVRGTAANDLIIFKCIPFAQPPIGALRWRPPQAVKAWE